MVTFFGRGATHLEGGGGGGGGGRRRASGDPSSTYLVMELYKCNLRDLCSNRALLEWEVAHIIKQVLEATAYMHGEDVIHRCG